MGSPVIVAQDVALNPVLSHKGRKDVMLHRICMPSASILKAFSEDIEMLVPGKVLRVFHLHKRPSAGYSCSPVQMASWQYLFRGVDLHMV